MGAYKNAGILYLITGLVSLGFMISPLMLFFGATDINAISLWLTIFVYLGLIEFILYLIMGGLTFSLGSEADNGTLKAAAIFIILTALVLAGAAITFMGGLANLSYNMIMASMGLLGLFFILSLISFILLGLGLRSLGDQLGSSNLGTAGILVLIGAFIGILAAIGLIIAGLELMKQE